MAACDQTHSLAGTFRRCTEEFLMNALVNAASNFPLALRRLNVISLPQHEV